MTEIPEHLLKRAQRAREQAAGEVVRDYGAGHLWTETTTETKIPAHLLSRAEAARKKREPGIERGQVNMVVARQPRTIPFAHTKPAEYNTMIEQIRACFPEHSIEWNPPPAPDTRYVPWRLWIQQPGSWVVIAFLAVMFVVLIFLALMPK